MTHKRLNKHLCLFDIGGVLYLAIEIVWRERSHWSMFLLGGLCFVCLGLINEIIPWETALWGLFWTIGFDTGNSGKTGRITA